MSCLAKGGDTLSHYMQRNGCNFVDAARALGAWEEAKPWGVADKPAQLSSRDAMEAVAKELQFLMVVISDARNGLLPSPMDWQAFLAGAGVLLLLISEYRN